jgi:rhodanese-related sulfurtransferase
MSTHSLPTLKYITNADLSSKLLSTPITPTGPIAIIDVRDSDYIGGHILGCQNVPSGNLDWKMPELVRTLRDKEIVVFHCALSQQRGPSAALRYLRERERMSEKERGRKQEGGGEVKEQVVYVLEGGFVKWQEQFGEDTRLTEGYQKDIWQDNWY